VPALIREEVPFGVSTFLKLTEPHQFIGEEAEICGVLMASALESLGSRISIPLFAGDLTPPTCRAFRRIYEKGFICHLSHLL
jgi:hypothetical protein